MVTMPKFDMDKVQLTLETGTSPAYIDFGYLDQVLAVIMWWYKDVPYNSKNMDAEIRSALMKSPIELYCIISRNGVSITTYISLSYVKNGIFLDPQFALQYPILINDRQYMPAVTDSSELNSYLSVGRYPVMLINRITNAKSPEAHSIERFFQN